MESGGTDLILAMVVRIRQNRLEYGRWWNLKISAEIWPVWSESGQYSRIPANLARIWKFLLESDQTRLDFDSTGYISASFVGIWVVEIQRWRSDIVGFRFTQLVIFSYEPNAKNYF